MVSNRSVYFSLVISTMEDIIKRFKLEYNFSKHGMLNESISNYLATIDTEQTDRPVYYHVKDVNLWGKTWTAIYISTFYRTNPGYCFGIGKHDADVEKIIILMTADCLKPEWVYFSAHGNGQGTWVQWEKCMFTKDKALRIFVSPASNGHYPRPGMYMRVGGFANDVCYDGQVKWRPSENDFCNSLEQAWTRSHYQVARGINTPAHPDPPPVYTVSYIERFFLFLPSVKKKVDSIQGGVFV